jgi:hypothetical protein
MDLVIDENITTFSEPVEFNYSDEQDILEIQQQTTSKPIQDIPENINATVCSQELEFCVNIDTFDNNIEIIENNKTSYNQIESVQEPVVEESIEEYVLKKSVVEEPVVETSVVNDAELKRIIANRRRRRF